MSVEFNYNPQASLAIEEVLVAGNRGTCGGVEMSLAAVEQIMGIVPPDVDVWTTNTPVNYPPAFEKYGQRLKNANGNISRVPDGAVLIISAHGAAPEVFQEAWERGIFAIDTSCSIVLDGQMEIKKAAAKEIPSIFLGEENHPETRGIKGQVEPDMLTIFDPSKPIPADTQIPNGTRIFAKTTNDPDITDTRIAELEAINPNIDSSGARSCYALRNRFTAGKDLIAKADFWLVVGDQSSNNARGIKHIGEERDIPSALVNGPEEIDWSWFTPNVRTVGVSAAASVPEEFTQRVLIPFRMLGIPVIDLPQTVKERYRMFKLPNKQLSALIRRYENKND